MSREVNDFSDIAELRHHLELALVHLSFAAAEFIDHVDSELELKLIRLARDHVSSVLSLLVTKFESPAK